jgi:predicted permease
VTAVLINVLLPIAVVVAVGYALRRVFPIDQVSLNRVMIYGLSPALIFVSLLRADLGGSGALRMIGFCIGLLVMMALVTVALAWPLGLRGGDLSALLLVSLFMNSGNYGLPAARFAFGEAGFTQALFFFIAQSIMAQTLGVAVAAAGSAGRGGGMLREVLGRVLRMPQVYAVAAALLLRATGFNLATAGGVAGGLFNGVALLSEAALPLMLLILGMQLGTGVVIEQPGLVAFATGLRLLISPILAYGLGTAMGLHGMNLAVGVMLAGMPTAVNTTIIAIEFNSRPSLVVGTVVASSVVSLATLTVLLGLVRV